MSSLRGNVMNHECIYYFKKYMLHKGSLRVIYIVGEAGFQRIIDLSIFVQLIDDQLVHYINIERWWNLQSQHTVAVFQSPYYLLVCSCWKAMRDSIRWQVMINSNVIYWVYIKFGKFHAGRIVSFVEILHKWQRVEGIKEFDIIPATEKPTVLEVNDLLGLV